MTEQQLRNQVVGTMRGWLGWSEANGKFKSIIDLYNSHKPLARGYKVKYTDEWCATAVSAVAISCGLTDIMPTECSCGKMIELYKKLGRWQENDGYTPSPGDIIMYDWQDKGSGDNSGNPDHVGIVEKVVGGSITVIEGNKGEAVARRTLAVNGRYIRGYCLPNFASKAQQTASVSVSLSVLTRGCKGSEVKALQALLTVNGFPCDTDGSFGPATEETVKKFQKAKALTVDGSVGPQTWPELF